MKFLGVCNIAKELKRSANILERIHVFILLAVEKGLSVVAVVAGLTNVSFQTVMMFRINDNFVLDSVFTWLKMSSKHLGIDLL